MALKTSGRGNVHPGYASMGTHVDDYEAQHAMLNEHGEVMFNTGIESGLRGCRAPLFPDDEAARLSRSATELGETSLAILRRAWVVLEKWEGKRIGKKHRKKALKASGLKVIEHPPLGWDGYRLPSTPEKLHARLNSELDNVRWRWVMYGPKA